MGEVMKPELGMIVNVRGVKCRIVAVLPFGTIDVEALDGSGCWRVSGLSF
jgi:hypothetical protein